MTHGDNHPPAAGRQMTPDSHAASIEAECARRQRIATFGLAGGPIVFVGAVALFVYSATVPADGHRYWGGLGTICLLVSLGLLVWGGHYMDCTDRGESPSKE